MEQQIKELEEKTIELNKVNDLLHDQLQELGLKVSVIDSSLSVSTFFYLYCFYNNWSVVYQIQKTWNSQEFFNIDYSCNLMKKIL